MNGKLHEELAFRARREAHNDWRRDGGVLALAGAKSAMRRGGVTTLIIEAEYLSVAEESAAEIVFLAAYFQRLRELALPEEQQ